MDPRIKLVINEMKRDMSQTIPLCLVAQKVNLSTSRLRHLFREETGSSYDQFYRTLRVDHGKILLEQPNFLSIKEVRVRTGFNTKEQFARYFKRHLGVTPKQYRLDCWQRGLTELELTKLESS